MDGFTQYCQFCDDFGPMNMTSVTRFIESIEVQMKQLAKSQARYLVCCAGTSRRSFTSAAFLLGA